MEKPQMKPWVGACVKFDEESYYKVIKVTKDYFITDWYRLNGTRLSTDAHEWEHNSFLTSGEKLMLTPEMVLKAIKNAL